MKISEYIMNMLLIVLAAVFGTIEFMQGKYMYGSAFAVFAVVYNISFYMDIKRIER